MRTWTRSYWLVLVAYAAGYALFPPRVLLVNDEERYVAQAMAFARGSANLAGATTLLPRSTERVASNYPPGTSALQAPFVALFGWRGAGLLSVVSLALLVAATIVLLRDQRYDTRFALVVPAFVGSLFFGRLAMSDMPGAALAAFALVLLFRRERSWRTTFAAGAAAGATLLFREPLALFLAPFIVGDVLPWKRGTPALLLGGAAGVLARLAVAAALFGDPLYVRDSGYGFGWSYGAANLGVYAVVLLVLLPAGAALLFLYRGARYVEVRASAVAYIALFLFYGYEPWAENGLARGTLLATRFAIPLLPLVALSAADVLPRWLGARVTEPRAARLGVMATAAVAIAAFAVHPAIRRTESGPDAIVSVLHARTRAEEPIVINEKAVGKYLSPVYGARLLVWRSSADAAALHDLCARHSALQMALLDRTDSPMFRGDADANAQFVRATQREFVTTLTYDGFFGRDLHLRIYRVGCFRGATN